MAIAQANITDERFSTELCGLINSVLGLDPSAWQAQFDDFIAGMLLQENEFLATHEAKFITQLNEQETGFQSQMSRQENEYQARTSELLSVYYAIRHDMSKLQTFSFDNLAALAGASKKSVFTDDAQGKTKTITETIRNSHNQDKIAERETTFVDENTVNQVTTVFDLDGESILKQAVYTCSFNADGSVDETIDGFDDYTLNAAFVGGISIDGGSI